MSIVINALKKAGKNRKEAKRKHLSGNFFSGHLSTGKKSRGFVWGILFGVFLVTVVFAMGGAYFLLRRDEKDVPARQSIREETLVSDIDLEELDDDEVGLDIEDELYLENILRDDKNVSEESKKEIVEDQTKKRSVALTDMGFPDLIVSGVVWDFSQNYVFINGVPYRENDFCGDIKILKISLSRLDLMFEGKEYEIVLK